MVEYANQSEGLSICERYADSQCPMGVSRDQTTGEPITQAIDREAKQLVIRQVGRKWSRKHDVDYVAYMVRNHYLPSEELDKAREEYAEERALKREHRCEAGNPPNHAIRVW